MAMLGKRNLLSVNRESTPGLYLDGGELGEILLPGRYIPKNLAQGQKIGVFVYRGSKDRLVATTETPDAMVGKLRPHGREAKMGCSRRTAKHRRCTKALGPEYDVLTSCQSWGSRRKGRPPSA